MGGDGRQDDANRVQEGTALTIVACKKLDCNLLRGLQPIELAKACPNQVPSSMVTMVAEDRFVHYHRQPIRFVLRSVA